MSPRLDPDRPEPGSAFDGRIVEDFELSTGSVVSVGPLREKIIAAGAPLVRDVVVAGIDRSDVGILLFMRLDACRDFCGLADNVPTHIALGHPHLRAFLQRLVDALHATGSGGASRVARALVLAEPPSIDRGEVTATGSIDPAVVLAGRAADVARLHAGRDRDVIVPQPASADLHGTRNRA